MHPKGDKMKLAVIGSRNISADNMETYFPPGVTEIVSGGATGIDAQAEEYAKQANIKYTVFLPDYARYGKAAPLKRNDQIAAYADEALAFWDGRSRGTQYTIRQFYKWGKRVRVVILPEKNA